ncbi:MAG: hypothetical protein WCI57_01560 [Candidatus Berkelbacteria bacterium]
MSDFTQEQRERLLHAINTEDLELVEKLLASAGDDKISESCMAAAERTDNKDVAGIVLDHILNFGLDVDHDFPTQLHWALARGFRMAAANLASVITDEDLLATDSNGMTVLELARKLKYFDVEDLLEDRS